MMLVLTTIDPFWEIMTLSFLQYFLFQPYYFLRHHPCYFSYILKSVSALCFGMCCKRKINFLSLCAEMIKPGNKHVISLVIDRLVWHLDDVFVRDC